MPNEDPCMGCQVGPNLEPNFKLGKVGAISTRVGVVMSGILSLLFGGFEPTVLACELVASFVSKYFRVENVTDSLKLCRLFYR